MTASSIIPERGFAIPASEGADTWSAVQALAQARSIRSLTAAK
jgi:hypothetical protein